MKIKKYVVLQQWGEGITCIKLTTSDLEEAIRAATYFSTYSGNKGARPHCLVFEMLHEVKARKADES